MAQMLHTLESIQPESIDCVAPDAPTETRTDGSDPDGRSQGAPE
jgi:hypothetical protein